MAMSPSLDQEELPVVERDESEVEDGSESGDNEAANTTPAKAVNAAGNHKTNESTSFLNTPLKAIGSLFFRKPSLQPAQGDMAPSNSKSNNSATLPRVTRLNPQKLQSSSHDEYFSAAGTSPAGRAANKADEVINGDSHMVDEMKGVVEERLETRKRTRNQGQDTHDLHEANEEDIHDTEAGPRKRTRRAKLPLATAQSRSNGSAEKGRPRKPPPPATAPTASVAEKRKPGRPRKEPPKSTSSNTEGTTKAVTGKGKILPLPKEHRPSSTELATLQPAKSNHKERNSMAMESSAEDSADELPRPEEEGEITDILLNPSPVKPASPFKRKNMKVADPISKRQSGVIVPAQKLRSNPTQESQSSADMYFVNPSKLETMLDGLQKVGHKFNRESKTWELKKSYDKVLTIAGKKLDKALDELLNAYESLEASDSSSQEVLVASVEKKCESILTTRLVCPPNFNEDLDPFDTRKMLRDLYFILIPKFLVVIMNALEAYTTEEPIATYALKEISVLLDLLYDLSETARDQPAKFQPFADAKRTYSIQKPVNIFIPQLRGLQNRFNSEIQRRKRPGKSLTKKPNAFDNAEIEEAQRQEEERAEKEKEELIRQHRIEQQAALEEQLADPLWGHILQAEIAKTEKNFWLAQSEKGQGRAETPAEDEEDVANLDDDDPFAEYPVERVRLFPKNNNHSTSRKLSDEERYIFIDLMRSQKDDRYEKASKRLNRSMEDIFGFAKALQELMDDMHANLQWDEPRDDWTWTVWNETSD